jgi:hypothetical protein
MKLQLLLFFKSYANAAKLMLLVLANFMISCSFTGPVRTDRKASGYQLAQLHSGWQALKAEDVGNADVVFSNNKSRALLSISSVCDRYPDASLDALTRQLLVPFQNVEMISTETIQISNRSALKKEVRGFVDGVPVHSLVTVLRKNECIFDFTMHAKDSLSENDIKDFNNFIRGFRYE